MKTARKPEPKKEREAIIRRFAHDGRTFEYNFSRLSLLQVQRAETVFRYREEQESNPPMTLEMLQASSGGEYILEAFRHLLIPVNIDGSYGKYNKESEGAETRDWLDDIPGTYWNELRECRLDFFTSAGLQDIESIKRFIRGNKQQLDALELQTKAAKLAKDMQSVQTGLVDSITVTNSKTVSENLGKTE